MGLMQSLGRLWGSSNAASRDQGHRRSNPDKPRPVSIDLHTPTRGEDVSAIDRELSDRLGLKPSPLPGREPVRQPAKSDARRPGRSVGVAAGVAGVAAGVGVAGTHAPDSPVSGEILDPVSTVIPVEGPAHPSSNGTHSNGNVLSALLALPHEARGRMKSKQQVLDQLRENYEEVIRVVRKVDSTLDQQHRRGERMLEIAEHTVHGRLPELREETRKVADAIDRLSTGIGRGHDRLEKGVADQIVAIERVQGLLTQLVEADRSLGESLVEFRRTAAGMAVATERLGSALAGMQDRASRRDDQIAEVLDRSQKTLVTVLVLSLVSVAAAITMVVLSVA